MFAICIESSHAKGMGHFFRAMNMVDFFKRKYIPFILLINSDEKAVSLLQEREIPLEIVDLKDVTTDWETRLINKYKITTWINDRLDTEMRHANNIKKNRIKLITFDDKGTGAVLSDINIAALVFENRDNLSGHKVLTGVEYLVLNTEIDNYKRLRTKAEKLVVTLGGSDTYGVTIKAMNILQKCGIPATVILGPTFSHWEELSKLPKENFDIKVGVSSLIEELSKYDIAITGGGITPFEANASGLPCIVIANEEHEIEIGRYLEHIGTSVFAGHHESINVECFNRNLEIEKMSKRGMDLIKTNALEKIYGEFIKC